MPDKKKQTRKDPRANLRNSQQQLAYYQLIKNETRTYKKNNDKKFNLYKEIIPMKNDYFYLLKKDNPLNNNLTIGSTLSDIKLTNSNLVFEKKNYINKLPFEKEKENNNFFPKDKKDCSYNKYKFLNTPLSKDLYNIPLKSSDEYGWLSPIDNMIRMGNELKSIEGADNISKGFIKKGKARKIT